MMGKVVQVDQISKSSFRDKQLDCFLYEKEGKLRSIQVADLKYIVVWQVVLKKGN